MLGHWNFRESLLNERWSAAQAEYSKVARPHCKVSERRQSSSWPAVTNSSQKDMLMKRYGSVIKVKPQSLAAYKKYHAQVWPEVLDMIRRCNIRNYSIYLKDEFLFGYFEYHGTDYQADMAKMAADRKTQEWWAIMMPMQEPLETRAPGEWWAIMEEVFHSD
jgi:L-rhamnose mutarotase